MAITRVNGTRGTKGKSGTHPTNGGNGGSASFSENGKIGADSITVDANGGAGGAGGNNTGTGPGGNGGNGGGSSISLNGNIFNAPATSTLHVALTATGGNGGPGGTGATPGTQGNGGSAHVSVNGNIVQTSKTMTTITFDAAALAGVGANYGNATATINGNIVQPAKANSVVLEALAIADFNGTDDVSHDGDPAFGIKQATINGNIVQGNINSVFLGADAYPSNGTANINGNIIQTQAANTGTVTLEATANHITISNNKVILGKQDFDLNVGAYSPYDVNVFNNTITGTGSNLFALTDTPSPDSPLQTAYVNLASDSFILDGQANALNKFGSITFAGDVQGALIGNSGNNTLSAASDTTTGLLVFDGNGGTDTITGGPHALNVAYFAGRETQYAIAGTLPGTNASPVTVTGGPTGDTSNDTLTGIQRLKFLSPAHVSDINDDGNSDLVFQQNTNGNLQIRLQGSTVVTENITGVGAAWKAIGTGQFTADTDRDAGILLQNSTTGALEVITGITPGVTPPNTTVSTTTQLALPAGASTTGWTAITAGDFNGDGASDILLQNNTTGAAEILFTNTKAGEPVGTVDSVGQVASPGAGWKIVSSGDFNGDGNSDIMWQNPTTGQTEIYLMNGSTIASTATLNSGSNLTAIGTGDFNGDGNSDVVFLNNTDHSAQIWLMNGTTETGSPITVAQPTPTGAETNFVLVGAEDVNGDGYSDLLWRDTTTGDVKATEFTTGGAVLKTVNLGAPASTFHLVASTGGG